jgi:excinuclease ABC subunit C
VKREPRHAALAREVRERAPEAPGVYLFRGDGDEILYVGKAVNLRKRMLSHLRVDRRVDEQRHARLVYEIQSFDIQPAASELLALLQEDELIKKHRPRYNVRQNEYLEYRYLELTNEEYPRLRTCDHRDDTAGRQVFGPYRDRFLVKDILQLVHHHLGLRSCTDISPARTCLEFDLGHCAGPCRSEVTPQDYGRVVARSMGFLQGYVSEVARGLQLAMEQASEKLEFEKAQEFKERLRFCRRFGERQRFLTAFRERQLVVVEKGEPERTYVFVRGWLTGHGTGGEATTSAPSGGAPALSDPGADPRFVLDRAAVVHGWLRRNTGRSEHRFVGLEFDRSGT